LAAKYAREKNVPYFGICLGMQIAIIEIARNKLGWTDANSEEINPDSKRKVVVFMPEISKTHMGGTMRLGSRKTILLDKTSKSAILYKRITGDEGHVMERHRHRYEVNPEYVKDLTATGVKFVGIDESGLRQEIIEIDEHPFYIGVQFHPEMKSRPIQPSPPFVGFMLAASGEFNNWLSSNTNGESNTNGASSSNGESNTNGST